MQFSKSFRGYNPQQVDKYIAETAQRERDIRVAQKDRIDQLTEENATLTEQLRQYQQDEQAISKSLIETQKLVEEMRGDAERFSQLVLARAKLFYASWRAYSKTLVATLSAEEVEAFNKIQKKLECIINAYEGKDVASELSQMAKNIRQSTEQSVSATDVIPSQTTMGTYKNPIKVVEQAIDLRELATTDLNLEEICKDLGLI
ncbi:MAG: DivIVA domain-containing protein [Clostridia bacterium]|nr:DivIVA domain-containing protein [Clostridia bacterium]